MRFLPVLLLVLLFACSKSDQQIEQTANDPEACDFGETNFNLSKRAQLSEELLGKGKPRPGTGTGGGGTTTPAAGVIFLDFDGHTVSGTSWNTAGDIVCTPANVSYDAIVSITNRVINDYSPFNVVITTNESVFNAAPVTARMRVIVTETWEWFGQAGGTAFTNSWGLSNNTPCFVFSSLLGYNEKSIAEAVSHEAGHTLGLRHQSTYSGTTLVSQYNYGQGSGEIGWAPIMGCGYYQNLTTWHNGPNSLGSTSMQDDVAIISAKLGFIADDHSNSTSGATLITTSANGVLNNAGDADYFSLSAPGSKTVSVTPYNIAAGNVAANNDIRLNIYNGQGQLLYSINDPAILNAGITLNAGQYYIAVSNVANAYSSTYGMLGRYTVNAY